LKSLNEPLARQRYAQVQQNHEKTFHWLFDQGVVPFYNWLAATDSTPSSIFWIKGLPGSGKSTLTKFAMRDPRTIRILSGENDHERDLWKLIGYFFHDRGATVQKSHSGLLKELLFQILLELPTTFQFMSSIYKVLVSQQRTSSVIWDSENLTKALLAIFQQRKRKISICMFIDALDEHDGDNNELAKTLHSMAKIADNNIVKLKICVASRTWTVFEHHFGSCPNFAIQEHTQRDIEEYTNSILQESLPKTQEPPYDSSHIQELANQIRRKARGVFIWVKLVVGEISRGIRDGTPLFVLKEKISSMPEELENLYTRTIQRIEPAYKQEAIHMFEIAFAALRPLPLTLFLDVVDYHLYDMPVPNNHHIHASELADSMQLRLISRTGGLLEIIEGPADILEGNNTVAKASMDVPYSPGSASSLSDPAPVDISEGNDTKGPLPSLISENSVELTGTTLFVQFIHQTLRDYVRKRRFSHNFDNQQNTKLESSNYALHPIEEAEIYNSGEWILLQTVHKVVLPEQYIYSDDFKYLRTLDEYVGNLHGNTSLNLCSAFITLILDVAHRNRELMARILNDPYAYDGLETSNTEDDLTLGLPVTLGLHNIVTMLLLYKSDEIRCSPDPVYLAVCGEKFDDTSSAGQSRAKMLHVLADAGYDMNARQYGRTVLELIAGMGRLRYRRILDRLLSEQDLIEIASALLAKGANPNGGLLGPNQLLLTCAEADRSEIFKLLLDYGADWRDNYDDRLELAKAIAGKPQMCHAFLEYKDKLTTTSGKLAERDIEANRIHKFLIAPSLSAAAAAVPWLAKSIALTEEDKSRNNLTR
jgi:hypothetical protein